MADRMKRMKPHRLGVEGARGRSVSAGDGEGAKLIQRVEMRRIETQDIHVGVPGSVILAADGEAAGTFERLTERTHVPRTG